MAPSHLLLAVVAAAAVSGAYVQTHDCAGGHTDQGMEAFIRGYEDAHMQLRLNVFDSVEQNERCKAGQDRENATGTLKMATLGSVDIYSAVASNYSCSSNVWAHYELDYNVSQPHLMDTYLIRVELRDSDDLVQGCIDAHLTPEIPRKVVQAITWVPVSIFALIVLVALWKETASLSLDPGDDLGSSIRGSSHVHVTRVADYLSYLHFIFFSAALSLHYPGFLQPVASRTSWSTLMFPAGMVQRKSWYPGISDGIYETNGTMTGSAGLEVMTQVVGGAVTFDNWLNIISLAALVFFALVALVYLGIKLVWSTDWFRSTRALVIRHDTDEQANLTAVLCTATRLLCVYLLFPLVVWTTYQLIEAGQIPIYYSVASTIVICALVLLAWWGMFYSGPHKMGYLLIDDPKGRGDLPSPSCVENHYATTVYVMLVLRGVVHGSLELHGTVQLFILMVFEVIQLVLQAFILRISPISSRSGAMPLLRLIHLAFLVGFLPNVAGHSSRVAIGYVIIVIHTLGIVGLFFVPALLDLGALVRGVCLSRDNDKPLESGGDQPQVYGLRQLRQRPTNPSSLARTPLDDQSNLAPPQFSPAVPRRPTSLSSYRDSPFSDADQPSFFRPPRSSSAMLASRLSSSTLPQAATDGHSSPGSSTSSGRRHLIRTSGGSSSLRSSESDDGSGRWAGAGTDGGKSSESRCEPSPLDPNVDYSIREADLYYVNPRKLSFGQAQPEGKGKLQDRILSLWTKK